MLIITINIGCGKNLNKDNDYYSCTKHWGGMTIIRIYNRDFKRYVERSLSRGDDIENHINLKTCKITVELENLIIKYETKDIIENEKTTK